MDEATIECFARYKVGKLGFASFRREKFLQKVGQEWR